MVIRTLGDGSYEWSCEDCGWRHLEGAHRGPRKSVCKACQNKRYRRIGGDALRERNRYRMRLRRTGPGRTGQVGTIAGPEQRCFPLRTRPGLWKGPYTPKCSGTESDGNVPGPIYPVALACLGARQYLHVAHFPPPFSASNSRRTSSSAMSADQPYAAATAASRAACESTSHRGRAL